MEVSVCQDLYKESYPQEWGLDSTLAYMEGITNYERVSLLTGLMKANAMIRKQFLSDWIIPIEGVLWGTNKDDASITIFLKPKKVVLGEGSDALFDSMHLSKVKLPSLELSKLAGQKLMFSQNPDTGYIDGSIYVCGVHNPVDVTEMEFGKLVGDRLEANLHCHFDMEFENSGFSNFRHNLSVAIRRHDSDKYPGQSYREKGFS